nr:hypothetical protein CFP56_48499 [Quercus suber]
MSREEPVPSPVVVLGSQQVSAAVQTRNEVRVVVQEERCDSDVGAGTEATFTLEIVGKSKDLGDGFEERIEEIDRGLKLFDRSESLNPSNEKDRMLGDEISSEHATKSLAFGKLLATNFNKSNAFINEPLVYTVEVFNGLADLGGHAHASMPMQNVECSVDNAVNNMGLPSRLPSNTKTLPLSDITNQVTKQPRKGPKKKWSKLGREVDENNVSTDMEAQRKIVVDEHKAEYFIIMAWMLWNKRNLICLNHPAQTLENITSAAGNFLWDFLKAQEPVQVTRQVATVHHWCPPPHARFKANFDSVIFQSSNEAGIKVVIRNHRGEIIGSLSLRIPLPPIVAEFEALACRRAVLFAKELRLHEVFF